MSGNHAIFVAESASWVAINLGARLARLADEGFVVHVAAPDDRGFSELPPGCIERPLPGGIASWPGAFVLLQAHLIEHQPLLVHGFGMPWAWLATVAADRVGAPAIFANVDHHYLGDSDQPRALALAETVGLPVDGLWRSLYGFLGARVDRYVTTTHEDMELAQSFVVGQKLEVALGAYGVDVQSLNPYDSSLPSKADLVELLGATGASVVGLPSDLSPEVMRHWTQALETELPGVRVVTPEQFGARDIRDFFRVLDVFVAPEPGVRWCQLAAACGCAVVAADHRGHREVVEDGETGELARSADLATRAAQLARDPARAEKMGVRARTRAVARFDRRQVDDQMLRLYDAVLRGKLS